MLVSTTTTFNALNVKPLHLLKLLTSSTADQQPTIKMSRL